MSAKSFILFVGLIFRRIVDILSVKPFTDFPISFLDLILASILIKFIFSFVTGGYKEMDNGNLIKGFNFVHGQVSKKMSNREREKQVVNQKQIRQYRAIKNKVSVKDGVVFESKTGRVIE